MADTGINYTVTVTKAGAGGTEAAVELQRLAAAAAATNTVTKSTEVSTAALTKGYRALSGVLTVAGMQTFPQLTAAVMVTKQSLDAVRASGVQLQANARLVGAGIAGLTAIVLTGAQAWYTYRARKQEALSEGNLAAQTEDFATRLRNDLVELNEAGKITNEQFKELSRTLGTLSGNAQVREFITGLKTPGAQERIADFNRSTAFAEATNARDFPNPSKAQQALNIQMQYNAEVKLYNQLLNEGLITTKEFRDRQLEANTKQINSLVNLRNEVTQIQQLARESATLFATEFSGAIVGAFRQGRFEAKQFFSDLLAQVSQMIMQMAIMRILFGATGQSTGTGGLIGGWINKAAAGGMFPRMMAAGGMAGVQSVSAPTYFPRFNVVAGEAGREMLTVLARPRMMEVGGMQAVVGSAQGNRLAITSADALAQSGRTSGMVDIRVTLSPELRAEIVNQSVENARVTVAQDLRADSHISRGVRSLVG